MYVYMLPFCLNNLCSVCGARASECSFCAVIYVCMTVLRYIKEGMLYFDVLAARICMPMKSKYGELLLSRF